MKEQCDLPSTPSELYDLISRVLELPESVRRLELVFEARQVVNVSVTYMEFNKLRPFHRNTLKAAGQAAGEPPV